jgi:hypothetical protein
MDDIVGFVSTSDTLKFSGALKTAITQNGGTESSIKVAVDAVDFQTGHGTTHAAVIEATGTVADEAALKEADFTTSVADALGTVTTGGAEKFIFIVNTADGLHSGVYLATVAGANVDDLADAEIQLLGIIGDNIVAADVLFG